ncbi:DUF6503 family protein [Hyunsoonleella aestuarii]|uniref:Aspartyl-tRNA synthetase n=1 Tax=Hyunsoonleella aestuarii TaxID=912802 RepID=A0ABP8E9Z3_9FLAO|nr:DUF6503 family protein [Hyunsoonleella aestuarii]
MKHFSLLLFVLFVSILHSQELTGPQLLDKTITYHDPNSNWKTFNGSLQITMEIPEKPNRNSDIYIDLPKQFFSVKATIEDNVTEYIVNKDSVTIILNAVKNPSESVLKENRLSKDRAKLYKNYYTYLYGLPMKLKDEGTIISDKVMSKTFKGKSYWVLKVTYRKDVGDDIWYFYFDKNTFAMEVYQFFHEESKNDGEYILLSGEEIINGIKMPKNRAWYMNKDDKYLGTDILHPSK